MPDKFAYEAAVKFMKDMAEQAGLRGVIVTPNTSYQEVIARVRVKADAEKLIGVMGKHGVKGIYEFVDVLPYVAIKNHTVSMKVVDKPKKVMGTMDIYHDLLQGMGSLKNASEEEVSSMDAFISGRKEIRVASMDDLFNFLRIGNDTLIHKAEKDLWKIGENEKGEVVIERLFDPSSQKPLKI